MNVDAILNQAIAFSSEGIGAVMLNIAQVIYTALFPANSEAARPILIPA
ncbi:hypothetical protein [Corynebacterium nasicanis]|uniref:Uncharacterized protein n=1 Tax=Corynebacterium nasicanis TaxID=1448267 RepID=A0ABW1QEG2_9CORY